MNPKTSKVHYIEFFLLFVLIFFMITYGVTHKDTINKEFEALGTVGHVFASATIKQLIPSSSYDRVITNIETYEVEILIHESINEIRIEKGMKPLIWDPMIAHMARTHSSDMAMNSFFNHTNEYLEGPNERARQYGIKTSITEDGFLHEGIGENLGIMPRGIVEDLGVIILEEDVAAAMVLEWMLSEPHRENILNPTYKFGGIGVVFDGEENFYITHNFQ